MNWKALGAALFTLFVGATASARPITVRLDAPDDVIRHRTGALSLGIRYADGTIAGAGLFELKDLQAGTKSKPFFLDDTKTVANCEYEWLVMNKVPGDPRPPSATLLLPAGFDGVIKGHCAIDATTSELVLSLSPFVYETLEITIPEKALADRDAALLLAQVTPAGKLTDRYASWYVRAVKTTTLPLKQVTNLLAREPLLFKLHTLWKLNSGKAVKESFETEKFEIELR